MKKAQFPTVIDTQEKYKFRSFTVVEQTLMFPDGGATKHLTLEHPGAVVVLGKTSQNQIVFIKQYRPSIGREIIELPAGTLGKDEQPIECAHREFAEETGYGARSMVDLGMFYPTPGFCSEIQYLFFATDLYPKELPKDEDEIIEPYQVSIDRLDDLVLSDSLIDAKSLAIIYKAKLKGLL